MNISIIIPNYNGEKILKKNLPSVLLAAKEYTTGTVEIIIPDDASSDNSKEVIDDFIASIKDKHIVGKTMINTNRSLGGFSANVNRGVSLATGEILIFLNSDIVPHKDFLQYLLPHFSDPNVFAVGCMDESIENGKTVERGRGVGKWQRGFLTHRLGNMDQTNTLWVSGGSGAFRKSMYEKIGGLQNMYNPFYWEDIDLSYRAQKAGYAILFEKKSKVIHEHNLGAIATNYKPFRIQKIVYRNMLFFVWLNITDADFLLSHFLWLPYYFAKTLSKGDFAFWVGFYLALLQLPKVLREREKTKQLFVKSDKDVLVQFA